MAVVNPMLCLLIAAGTTAAAGALAAVARRRRSRALRRLVQRWGMNFQETDRLQLKRRIVEHLTIPGAADVAISDVAFRRGAAGHQYIFTLGYTLGTADRLVRCERAAGFTEGKGDVPPSLVLTPTENEPTLFEQYEDVAEALGLSSKSPAAPAPESPLPDTPAPAVPVD